MYTVCERERARFFLLLYFLRALQRYFVQNKMVITGRERVLLPYTTITIQFLDLGIIHSFIHLFYITKCLHLIPKRFYAIRNVCRLVFVTLEVDDFGVCVSFSLFLFMICIVPTS